MIFHYEIKDIYMCVCVCLTPGAKEILFTNFSGAKFDSF